MRQVRRRNPTVIVRRWFRRGVERPLRSAVGGRARLRVVTLLACVLALNAADTATVGAVAGQLEAALGVGNTEIGLLVSVSTGIGALATLPVGVLVDRTNRVRLLTVSIVVWCAAMLASGAAVSYTMLLITRLALGAVVATASPVVASLTGDLFPSAERGRIYGYILSGELVGAAVGFLVCGDIAAVTSWRFAFWVLVPPGLALAATIRHRLPEPARGGASELRPGQLRIPTVADTDVDPAGATANATAPAGTTGGPADQEGLLPQEVRHQHVSPHRQLILEKDPTRRSLGWAVRYVLAIRTNLVLIIASALGYFYFTGLRTFAVVYLRARFGLGQAAGSTLLVAIGVGAIVGVLVTGRIADRLIARHHVAARPLVAGICFLGCAVLLAAGLLIGGLFVALPLFFFAAAGLGGANPPLDAARLDIMQSRLWGRAESVRTVLRAGLVAVSPVLFGVTSTAFNGDRGLGNTFLLMLVTVLAAGLLLLIAARRTYPRDVATAEASEEASSVA